MRILHQIFNEKQFCICFFDSKKILKCPCMWILGIRNFTFNKSSFIGKQSFFLNKDVRMRLINGKTLHILNNLQAWIWYSFILNLCNVLYTFIWPIFTTRKFSYVTGDTGFDCIKNSFLFSKILRLVWDVLP